MQKKTRLKLIFPVLITGLALMMAGLIPVSVPGISNASTDNGAETAYAFPSTHMVAPKNKALNCTECHIRENGRIANLSGIYLPGRDRLQLVDTIGWLAVFGALIAVVLHGVGKLFSRNGKEE